MPDYYYLAGSNKCGMGYREVNWSLPRAQQVIHTRQNIYDGTWKKTPRMGWMFVPLTQYHGGGAAATIEPLDEHLDHYERMLDSNLGLGVQACYRGPRLYDTDRDAGDWSRSGSTGSRSYRDILESDVDPRPPRRRPRPRLDAARQPAPRHKGLLVGLQPAPNTRSTKTSDVNLYYTGLTDTAMVSHADGTPREVLLDSHHRVELAVTVPADGFSWFTFTN